MKRVKGAENIFEDKIVESFSNLEKKTFRPRKHRESQTGSTQRGPIKIHVIKIVKIKETIKSSKRKATSYVQGYKAHS